MEEIAVSHPGRTEQIQSLASLLCQPHQPLPASIVLHDANSPNTTSRLVHDLLSSHAADQAQETYPFFWTTVSPLISINPIALFRNILESFERQMLRHHARLSSTKADNVSGAGPSSTATKRKRRPDTSIDYFLWKLTSIMDLIGVGTFVIVINDAERIRDLWPEHVWTSFCRLSSLTRKEGQISTVFVSSLPWSQYRTPSGLTVAHQPLTIRFPRLGRSDILSILSLDFPDLWLSYQSSLRSTQIHAGTSAGLCSPSTLSKLKTTGSGDNVTQASLRNLYEQFIGLFYDTIRSNVRDIEELRTMSAAVWYSFVVPVQTRECSTNDLQALLLASSALFRDVIVRLQTREVGPREWTRESRFKSIDASKARIASAKAPLDAPKSTQGDIEMVNEEQKLDEEEWLDREMENLQRIRSTSSQATVSLLPSLALIPTFLVLASFLASYNPSRLDVRYFLRDDSLLSLSSGSGKAKSLKGGGRKLGPGRGRKASSKGGGRRGRPSKTALRVTTEDGQTENLNRQQLLGPKPFPIDRLLSIFQALITESAPEMSMVYASLTPSSEYNEGTLGDRTTIWEFRSKSLSVYSQINNLVARRMLVRTSAQDKLGTSINFRTNVGYNVASVLAKRVKFDLDEWLWDWGAGGGNSI